MIVVITIAIIMVYGLSVMFNGWNSQKWSSDAKAGTIVSIVLLSLVFLMIKYPDARETGINFIW